MSEHKIKVAITCGDPHGVGMETIIKVFSDPRMMESLTPVIYAHPEVVKVYRKTTHSDDFQYNSINSAGEAVHKKVNLVNCWKEYKGPVQPGKPDKEAGTFAFKSLEMAVSDLASNKVDAPGIGRDSMQSFQH